MSFSLSFVRGFTVGLEYVDLDEDDNSYMGLTDASFMAYLSLGFIRFTYINGYPNED